MAGYLITLSNEESLEQIIESGTYSTVMKSPNYAAWAIAHEGTFADYLSMKEGDLIFFFVKRKVYGCGRLVNIQNDCKYFNYLGADAPTGDKSEDYAQTRLLCNGSSENRCLCIFEPFPAFFRHGIDMDEVLQNHDNPFRSVRTMWKVSFIKLDDDESTALFNQIIKSNEKALETSADWFSFERSLHDRIRRYELYKYKLSRHFLIRDCKDTSNNQLKHEMALEAALCEILSTESREPFGKWDYISHQVAASPLKPIDYMDKMDLFGYRFVPGYKIKSKYFIAEIKKGEATEDIVGQIMKYVDWVANEYASKDYSMIEAYIIASDFSDEAKEMVKSHCVRNFTKGYRPTKFCVWDKLKMVKYLINGDDIEFSVVDP